MKATSALFGVAVLFVAAPALACAPPPAAVPRAGETPTVAARREVLELQREMWAGAEAVYLARVAGISEAGGDVLTTFELITAVKSEGAGTVSLSSRQTRSCPTHAHPVGTFVILYAYNNRSGTGRVGHVVPVHDNADPRIPPLLRAAADRLRNSEPR